MLKKVLHTPIRELPGKILRGIRHYILGYPVHIVVETVNSCNLKCGHCFLTLYGPTIPDGKRGRLPLDTFQEFVNRLSPAIRHARFFQFSTFEALTHPDLFRMMDAVLAVNPKIQFPLLTNGMAFSDGIYESLAKYPVPEISVSLDGCRRETVERFKTGVSFDRVINALRAIPARLPGTLLKTVFVIHRDNAAELPDTLDFVNSFGVRTVFVSNLLTFTPEYEALALYRKEGNPDIERIFEAASKRATANGQALWLPATSPRLLGCEQGELLYVNSAGEVSPCDFLAVRTPFVFFGKRTQGAPVSFGNILKEKPLGIYRSRAARDFRKRLRAGKNLPLPCLSCLDAYGLMCSHRRKAWG